MILRVETKRLLDRLGQSDFKYREYNDVDVLSSISRWPLFELIERQMNDASGRSRVENSSATSGGDKNDIKSLINRISEGRNS